MSRGRVAAALAHQNASLLQSITREFAAMRGTSASQPRYAAAMATYRNTLVDAVHANAAAIEAVFGPADTGLLTNMLLTFRGTEVYDGLGSLWRHLAKDWTSEGEAAQAALRTTIVQMVSEECARLQRSGAHTATSEDPLRIVVPGCGQARLACDIALALCEQIPTGASEVVGIERSAAQLAFARHFLGTTRQDGMPPQPAELAFHPWLDAFPNNLDTRSRAARLTARGLAAPPPNLTLHEAAFGAHPMPPPATRPHVCVTSFFLDCVPEVSEGVQQIRDALRPGGLWIFAGPLHFYQGGEYEPRPSPSAAQLLELVQDHGFVLEPVAMAGAEGARAEGGSVPVMELQQAPLLPGVALVPAPYVARPGAFLDEAAWRVPLFAARKSKSHG